MIERYDELVTVFGGDGFIGRYVCEFLLRSGVRVRVASRDPRNSYFIQPLGQVGQFGFVQADITNADSVRRAVDGTSAVVNVVGVFGRKMQAVHVDGARNVAEAARAAKLIALLGRQHHATEGLPALDVGMRGRGLGKGELAVDVHAQPSLGDALDQPRDHRAHPRVLGHQGAAEEHPAERIVLRP